MNKLSVSVLFRVHFHYWLTENRLCFVLCCLLCRASYNLYTSNTCANDCRQPPPEEFAICQWCCVMSCHWLACTIPAWQFCMCKGRLCTFLASCFGLSVCEKVILYRVLCVCVFVKERDCWAACPLCLLLTHWFAGIMPTTTPIVCTLKRMKELSPRSTHAHSPVCQTAWQKPYNYPITWWIFTYTADPLKVNASFI